MLLIGPGGDPSEEQGDIGRDQRENRNIKSDCREYPNCARPVPTGELWLIRDLNKNCLRVRVWVNNRGYAHGRRTECLKILNKSIPFKLTKTNWIYHLVLSNFWNLSSDWLAKFCAFGPSSKQTTWSDVMLSLVWTKRSIYFLETLQVCSQN